MLTVIFTFFAFVNWSQTTTIKRGKRVTISGTAVNLKAGAAIKSSGKYYYIENLTSWSKDSEGKEFTVRGRLITYTTTVDIDDPHIQYLPMMIVIRRAKIEVR